MLSCQSCYGFNVLITIIIAYTLVALYASIKEVFEMKKRKRNKKNEKI